jgi:hypothetical protein
MSTEPHMSAGGGLTSWRDLAPRERWHWWQQRWHEAIALSERYRLALRCGWWEDSVRVEALAAFAAWVATYDTEVSIDPPGKLQLLGQLDWLRTVLRGGERAFDPPADRAGFDQYLESIGCRAPHGHHSSEPPPTAQLQRHHGELDAQLAAVEHRLLELDERQRTLRDELDGTPAPGEEQARRDLAELERTLAQLRRRRRELRCQLDETHDAG